MSSTAQLRPLPDGLFSGLRWFRETDGPFTLDRSKEPLDYDLNKGWGLLVLYSRQPKERIGVTIESGMWWFKNDTKGITPGGVGYDQRAITLPLMVGASFTVFNKGYVNLYLDLNGGFAYTQYIQRLDAGGMRVRPRTEPIYGATAVLSVGLFRVSGSDYRTGPRLGTSFFSLGGRNLRSLSGTIW